MPVDENNEQNDLALSIDPWENVDSTEQSEI